MNPRVRRALKKIIWPLAIVLVVFGLPYFIFFVYLPRKAEGEVQKARQRIAAAGDPVHPSDLAIPNIPEAENAARLYIEAFDYIEVYIQDNLYYTSIVLGQEDIADVSVLQDVSAELATSERPITLFRAAATMPKCSFLRRWKEQDTSYWELQQLRAGALLLALQSKMESHSQEIQPALEIYALVLGVSEAANEPFLLAQLARYSILQLAFGSLQSALNDSKPSAQQCRRIASDIAQISLDDDYIEALKAERAAGMALFDIIKEEGYSHEILEYLEDPPSELIGPREFLGKSGPGRFLIACDELNYLDAMEKLIGDAALSYRESLMPNKAYRPSMLALQMGMMARTIMPQFTGSQEKRDTAQATLDLSRIALLAKAHRAETGSYPDSLVALEEALGGELPEDPFSGEAYIYRREDAGFLVYSIGQDLRDDGGTPMLKSATAAKDIIIHCKQ